MAAEAAAGVADSAVAGVVVEDVENSVAGVVGEASAAVEAVRVATVVRARREDLARPEVLARLAAERVVRPTAATEDHRPLRPGLEAAREASHRKLEVTPFADPVPRRA